MRYATLTNEKDIAVIVGASELGKIYPAKGSSVSEEISYDTVRQVIDAGEQEVNDAVVSDIDARLSAIASMQSFAGKVRAALSNNADAITVAGWEKKSQRAARFVAGDATDTDNALLAKEVEIRGRSETVEALAQTILAKAAFLEQATMVVEAMVVNAQDKIKAATPAASLGELMDTMKVEANKQIGALVSQRPEDQDSTDVAIDAEKLKKTTSKKSKPAVTQKAESAEPS